MSTSALLPGAVWDRLDVSDWPVDRTEPAGSNKVTWLVCADTGELWLHKDIHVPSNGTAEGNDWAEIVACQVALLLGVPCAETRLCVRDGVRGSLSRSVIPSGVDLYDGGVILEDAHAPGYFRQTDGRKGLDPDRPRVRRPGHTLANIHGVLEHVKPPEGFQGPAESSGFDAFAGFMILDALVANRDRHEQNWAVLRPRLTDEPERLAPSFDHGGTLGYNLTDRDRERRAKDPAALERWAEKGTAYRFEHVPPAPTLVQHACAALRLSSPAAVRWWQGRLEALDLQPLQEALSSRAIPEVSEAAARFINKLLDLNRRRLEDAIGSGR